MYAHSRGFIEVLPGVAPAVLASFAGLAFGWLQAPSVEGRKIMDQIDGLREYLSVAEEERLEYLNPPDKTPETFERFLPYAVALDLENTWAKRFAGVLAAAAVGAAAGHAASSWYSGNHDIARDPVSFTDQHRQPAVRHDRIGLDGARLERQFQRWRQQRRRLLRRWRWWRRRLGLVTGGARRCDTQTSCSIDATVPMADR